MTDPRTGRGPCPSCGRDRLASAAEAVRIFHNLPPATAEALTAESVDRVCSWCHAVRDDGTWRYGTDPHKRAQTLARAGTKTAAEYLASMTAARGDDG